MIPIYTAGDIKAIEQESIVSEDITGIELMEMAARTFVKHFQQLKLKAKHIIVFCGFGNNGGDGLAIARILHKKGYDVSVYLLAHSTYTPDWEVNFTRLQNLDIPTYTIETTEDIPTDVTLYTKDTVIIDALWGYGLTRPVEGIGAAVIEHINSIGLVTIAVDIPSGICADKPLGGIHIHADYTITFEWRKRIMYIAPEAEACGTIIVAPLHFPKKATDEYAPAMYELTPHDAHDTLIPRKPFTHKYAYGHVCIIAGSQSMAGAAALCAKACVTTGAGLTTVVTASACMNAINAHVPEAMTVNSGINFIDNIIVPSKCTVIATGPGMGKEMLTTLSLKHALSQHYYIPWVIDADALNIIADNNIQSLIPAGAILTPHGGEFDRLFGKHTNDSDRIDTAVEKAKRYDCVIVLKGHHTAIIDTTGTVYFNMTGNAGMAKGGSGDVLTGMIAALRAQHYTAIDAAWLGVYLHGLSGDIATEQLTTYSVNALNIISNIPYAIKDTL